MNAAASTMKGFFLGTALTLAGLVASGCGNLGTGGQAPLPSATAPAGQKVETGSTNAGAPARVGIDNIAVGDKLTITFSDIPERPPPQDVRVKEDGTISLPLGVSVMAAGTKAGELEELIQKAYVPKYYVRLTVKVVPEERVIYVGGYVRSPGRYVFAGEMSVLKAIKVAGDFTDYANRRKVELIRADQTTPPIIVDCIKARRNPKYDVPVFPRDSINVPQRYF